MAYIFAIVLIAAGAMGMFGIMVTDDKLLGIFAVNHWHNVIHLAVGVLAGIAAYLGRGWSKAYFQVFGVVFIGLAALGLYHGEGMLFGYIANNHADVVLHAVLGVVALYLGFCCGCKSCCKKGE
jgi:hypothetical protein